MVFIVLKAVEWFFNIIYGLILVRCLLSWIPNARASKFGRIVHQLTEPVLGPIRSLLAKSPLGGPGMMLDFSPFIAMMLMEVLRRVIYVVATSFIA